VNGGSVPTTGDKNIVLGFMVGVPDPTADGQFVVGHCHTNPHYLLSGDYATSNQSKLGINLGATGTGNARAAVAPTATLHVKGQGATDATTSLLVENSSGTDQVEVKDDGSVFMYNLPTSDPGVSGQLWVDSGTLKVSS
jgi:hypothetical protein